MEERLKTATIPSIGGSLKASDNKYEQAFLKVSEEISALSTITWSGV